MNETNQSTQPVQNIPVAATAPPEKLQFGKISAMWLLTFASLVLAIGLVWWSLPEEAVEVVVRFPEGHGLQAEDQVLYRGIEVGTVESVHLNEDLNSVDANLRLNASAADVAREGTRFWIVRPQLSLSGITGLETAVGHKYVSLSPGPVDGKRQYEFEGLIAAPPRDSSKPGIEFVIRGDKRFSVSPGSNVTFRGVVVGRILSVNLSQDSRHVDVRAKIFEKYAHNLTTASRFWASSGINFDFSLSEGLKFDSESLASIAQGGVSFLTINNEGQNVSPGHVFKLFAKANDEWLVAADSVSTTTIELGGVVKLEKRWSQKSIIGRRNKTALINGIPYMDADGELFFLIPTSAMQIPEKAIEDSRAIAVFARDGVHMQTLGETKMVPSVGNQRVSMAAWRNVVRVDWLERADFRKPTQAENVLVVRANVTESDMMYLHYPIDASYIQEDWSLPQFDGDPEIWNGAAVLSAQDGKVIGMLLASGQTAEIITFDANWFAQTTSSESGATSSE